MRGLQMKVFLDHDLDDQVYVPSGSGTGYEVTEWLSKHPDRMPKKVILHSYNEIGRANMQKVLPESIMMPGVWLEEEI